jgi:vacuolar protein sorting-associated protein 35
MDALKHASNMICELRTGLLTPKNYYALYMATFDQLRHLEQYLIDGKHGRRLTELYELVQYAGNILPRLYLLICVGSVYIASKEAPAKDVLRDLVEMCRGEQHPTRGLFLRTYLSEMTKDKLPDTDSPYAGVGGSVRDSVEFVLQNFTEMNKLWVRLQHHGPTAQKAQREAEREDLRLLIGKNLSRLSSLEGVDVDLYANVVLHRLLEQVVSCRDVIAQQYLMECIIQVFPDEFQLATLDTVLQTCAQLQPAVNVRRIVTSLIDRLAEYSARDASASAAAISADDHVYTAFYDCCARLGAERANMPVHDMLALFTSLAGLALRSYGSDAAYVNRCLGAAADYLDALAKQTERAAQRHEPAAVQQLRRLLALPVEESESLARLLELDQYARCAAHLQFAGRREVAVAYARFANAKPSPVASTAQMATLFANCEPLLRDADDQQSGDALDDEDHAEQQNIVAALAHVLHHDEPEQHFALLVAARKAYSQGGPKRLRFTLTPLVFAALRVARRVYVAAGGAAAAADELWQAKGKKMLEFIHQTIGALAKTEGCSELAMRLYLQAALDAGRLGFETVSYDFMARAFTLYEELAKADAQFQALSLIIGTLQRATTFTADNYDTLVGKSAQYAAKLLQKEAQCRGVYLVSHLFWKRGADGSFEGHGHVHDGKRVLECFPEHDHQILTSDGFMFLDQVEQHLARNGGDWGALRVASYDAAKQTLVYRQPNQLVVKPTDSGLIEFSAAAESARWADADATTQSTASSKDARGVSVVCTRGHELFVQRAADAAFAKVQACELAAGVHARRTPAVRFLTAARGGVAAASGQLPAPLASLSDAQRAAFLELYGAVFVGGALDSAFCAPRLAALGVASLGDFVQHLRRSGGDDDADASRLAAWVWQLGAAQLECIVRGMCTDVSARAIVVDSETARDELVRLLLHAGYTATFSVAHAVGSRDGGVEFAAKRARASWRVAFSSRDADVEPELSFSDDDGDAHSDAVVRESGAYAGRTWCFDMESSAGKNDGFVVVRRALRVGGAVVQASRATIQGNCLQRSLKIADSCLDAGVIVSLFVEILNRYLYYFEGDNEAVSIKYLSGLVALINTNLANVEASESNSAVKTYYANTLAHIQLQKAGGSTRFAGIDVASSTGTTGATPS